MANTPISGFTSGAPAQSTDELVIARSGANFKLTAGDLRTLSIGAGSVSIASGKTLTGSNTLTLAGTDGTTMTFPATSATLARTDAGNTFTGNQTLASTAQLLWSTDLVLTRRGPANLRLGAADAAAPVPQLLSVQSVVAGTTNTIGRDFTITGSQGTGSGAGGSLIFQVAPANGGGGATVQNPLATVWQISGAGHFLAGTDNLYDIGASGATRPRTGYFGTSIIAPTIQVGSSANQTITSPSANTLDLKAAGATYFQLTAGKWNFLNWSNGSGNTITSSGPFGGVTNRSADPLILICEGGSGSASSGSIQFRAAPSTTSGTDAHVDEEAMRIRVSSAGVSILSFNGTTSSFPALKRSSTTLQTRLADDSDFASVQGKLTTETAYTAGAPTATGYIVLYDSTGTAYRVPAVLN